MNLKGKKVAILGAGGSGFAAATLALSHGASVAAFDSGEPERLAPAVDQFEAIGVVLTCGDAALTTAEKFDVAVLSPGIALSWPIAETFAEASSELIGEIEFASRLANSPIIAITGTNGKTTTTSLIAEMLRVAGLEVVAAGNIGLPLSSVANNGVDYDFIVLEVSSFQLETIDRFSPEIAVWTNFAPDHMDRYRSLEEYRNAKLRIFENWTENSTAICKLEDEVGPENGKVTFSAFSKGGDYHFHEGTILGGASGQGFDFSAAELQGRHNAENVMMALAVADTLEIDRATINASLEGFRAPSHRCEKIAIIDRVVFLNDSKSTNLHSLESALAGQDAPLVLIVGGKNKGLDYSELRELAARKVKQAICIGEIAEEIASSWSQSLPCEVASSLSNAVQRAASSARPGDVVLFSPGTSSFDMFSGYEARGEAFREAVETL